MPYNPISKFPEIIENLKRKHGNKDIGIETIWNEIIFVTGSVKDPTIQNLISVMRRLDYIRPTDNGRFDICEVNKSTGRPMWKKPKKEIEKEADGLLSKIGIGKK